MNQDAAEANRKNYGYRTHYKPQLARSRKNQLIAQGDYKMRVPFEDQLLADEILNAKYE